MEIVYAVAVLGVISIVMGAVLGLAAKYLDAPRGTPADRVEALLPGVNCGGCGYSGCRAYAKALAEGKAEIGKCRILKKEQEREIGKLVNRE